MEGTSLLSLPEGMLVEHIQITEHGLVIEVGTVHPTSCCPLCAEPSDSIQTHYRRVLRDAPCAGRQVQLVLKVRKFYCRSPSCSRKVFTERLPTFVEPWARMTIRCCQHITSIGLATCGKGGARAQWMRKPPDLAVVSRDRGGEYASAAREGAPQAIQCADRFHIVKNLTEAVQVLLARCQA